MVVPVRRVAGDLVIESNPELLLYAQEKLACSGTVQQTDKGGLEPKRDGREFSITLAIGRRAS